MHQAMSPRGRRSRRRPARGQSGATLIEVVIAVALTGLVILSLATAMLAIVRTNALNSDRQRVDAAMTSFSESLQALAYRDCADPGTYNTDFDAWDDAWERPDGAVATVNSVEYWDRDPESDTYRTYVDDDCNVDSGAQRLTVSIEWNGLSRQAQIVKRAP